jgi:MFS family permease
LQERGGPGVARPGARESDIGEERARPFEAEAAVQRTRRATATLFAYNGVLFGTWASEIPRTKAAYGLTEGELGVALLAVTLGTILVLPLIGRAIGWFGDAAVAATATILATAALATIPHGSGPLGLFVFLLVFGCAFGAQDVALNDAGVRLEREARRALLSGLHAMYSLGALVGAVGGAALIAMGLGSAEHFVLLAPVALFLGLLVARDLPSERTAAGPRDAGRDGLAFALRWPIAALGLIAAAAALGLIAAAAAIAEGGVADWSGVFLRESLDIAVGGEALGFAALSLAMLIGRLSGDGLAQRFGPVAVGRGGTLLGAAGALAVCAARTPATAIFGFGILGLGLSVLAPMAFSAVGRVAPDDTGRAVAAVTAYFYVGFLVSPPLIGALAEAGTLRAALLAFVACGLAAAVLAPVLSGDRQVSGGMRR